jgi:hypothetical protein
LSGKKSCNPADYPEFGKLPEEIVERKIRNLIQWIWGKEAPNDIIYEPSVLVRIVDMVERRRVYFHVYHGIDMGEWNEISLYCFWITKLQPFHKVFPKSPKIPNMESNEINARVVYRLLNNAVPMIIEKMSEDDKSKLKTNYRKNMIHAFRHRDISKESFMAIMEGLLRHRID